ncbi:MAG TPA: hypothetical protein VLT83_03095 [Opitutaceae bacterium]|nr:hypothetical protein [Opitutaceae bacterium]
MKPPRPPADVLRRVLKFSRLNGWSVAIFAGVCALVSLALLDPIGVAVCVLVLMGGLLEVHGSRRLRRREADGVRWLVRSQLVVLGVIWTYAVTRLASFDEGLVRDLITPELLSALRELGLTQEDILPLIRQFFYLLYGSVMAATLIYQGGLALYYHRRAAAVEAALRAPPIVAAAPSPDSSPASGDYTI